MKRLQKSSIPAKRRRRRASDGQRPTIRDVAAAAGVSIATVSRALNMPDTVTPSLRDDVAAAVRSTGYVRHGAARALVSRRSFTVGAIVPTLDNAIFARGINALQRRLQEGGYVLLVASSEYDPAREVAELRALIERGADGVMLIGTAHDPALFELARQAGLPLVLAWTSDGGAGLPCVGFDNARAAGRLADYLVDLGHRRFAMIAGIAVGNDRAAARVAGVREALRRRGLTLPAERVLERPYSVADGRVALRALMAQPEPPTAVLCGNDVLAFGALFEAQAQGIAVPGRVSITGFDDLDLATHVVPGLTTIRVPSDEMGARSADYLLARLAGRPVPDVTELEPALVVRGSSGPPAS